LRRALALWALLFAVYAAGVGGHLSAAETRQLHVVAGIADERTLDAASDVRLAPGVGLLAAPAYALGGRLAVQLWLAALTALGFVAAVPLARRLVPDPWATGGVLAVGLSPPAVIGATTITAYGVGAAAITGAAAIALSAREEPLPRLTAWAGVLLGTLPWLAYRLCAPGLVVLAAMFRWSRRRSRALAGLVGAEIALFSTVLYVSVNDKLYGGLTPSPPTWRPRFTDTSVELLWRAPVLALTVAAAWLLWRSRRGGLRRVLDPQVDVEVAALFLLAICAVGALVFVPVLPCAAALAAWSLRRFPRIGAALAALTLAATVYTLLAG
jgi:hypothetical protein